MKTIYSFFEVSEQIRVPRSNWSNFGDARDLALNLNANVGTEQSRTLMKTLIRKALEQGENDPALCPPSVKQEVMDYALQAHELHFDVKH